eukprot:6191246-Pleurochrysis_carterae.AAC.1
MIRAKPHQIANGTVSPFSKVHYPTYCCLQDSPYINPACQRARMHAAAYHFVLFCCHAGGSCQCDRSSTPRFSMALATAAGEALVAIYAYSVRPSGRIARIEACGLRPACYRGQQNVKRCILLRSVVKSVVRQHRSASALIRG